MIIISKLVPDSIKVELDRSGISYITGGKSQYILNETAYHPDMLYYQMNSGIVLEDCGTKSDVEKFCIIEKTKIPLTNNYPNDCSLNCFKIGKLTVCGYNADPRIIEDALDNNCKVLKVNQGYAACSTIIINDSACICSDPSISKALIAEGVDVLAVSNCGILLNGYNCGFIGGCALYSDKDKILFSGDITKHVDYDKLKWFCNNHGAFIYSLSKSSLYDYGGHRSIGKINHSI